MLDARRKLVGVITRKDVMPETIAARIHLKESEWETEAQAGNFVRASQILEGTVRQRDARDFNEVSVRSQADDRKARICQRIHLAEMYWRYRVIDGGKSPRDEALNVLNEALELLKRTRADDSAMELRSEEGQIKWMLAVARLVHNTDRSEDALIASLLEEALELAQELEDHEQIAEVQNSQGSLLEKSGELREAEELFLYSLRLRQRHTGELHPTTAQSCVSLGNLLANQPTRREEALSYLRDALRCYRASFGCATTAHRTRDLHSPPLRPEPSHVAVRGCPRGAPEGGVGARGDREGAQRRWAAGRGAGAH